MLTRVFHAFEWTSIVIWIHFLGQSTSIFIAWALTGSALRLLSLPALGTVLGGWGGNFPTRAVHITLKNGLPQGSSNPSQAKPPSSGETHLQRGPPAVFRSSSTASVQ